MDCRQKKSFNPAKRKLIAELEHEEGSCKLAGA
jgi:hypothetical protein